MRKTSWGFVAALALAGVGAGQEVPCSAYRLAVKTGADPGVDRVDLERPLKASLADLVKLRAPESTAVELGRRTPAERQLYRVRGTVVLQRSGDTRDYALVIKDERENSIIAEIPSPSCVPASSPFLERIRRAFSALDGRLHMDEQSLQVGLAIPVEITGVGFFDLEYLDRDDLPSGMAPNLFELNPILDVKFR